MRGSILFLGLWLLAGPAFADERAQVGFVKAYVHQLASFEELREQAAKNAAGTPNDKLLACVQDMTRLELELRTYVNELDSYDLPGNLKGFPGIIQGGYRKKMELYARLEQICELMLSTPKPGTDFGAVTAQMPKINAELDFNDQSMFKFSPAIALTLVDQDRKTDGKLRYLIVTKAERADLLHVLNRIKGIDSKGDTNYVVASAAIMKTMLTEKAYKAADE